MSDPILAILLTTYRRTDCALATIRALKTNLQWGNIWWMISDDGSPKEHVDTLLSEIGPTYKVDVYNSDRRGVGHGMNHCLRFIFNNTPLVLVMEDDWRLDHPLDLHPHAQTLLESDHYGLIRFGYLSTNLLGYTVSHNNQIYWRLEPNQETYRFTGHPSLRHRRFHDVYGYYDEGHTPGMTELSMCGKTNSREGPGLLYPAMCGAYGLFGHIGSESLADISPRY